MSDNVLIVFVVGLLVDFIVLNIAMITRNRDNDGMNR